MPGRGGGGGRIIVSCLVPCALALQGCSGEQSLLDPAGPAARRIEGLWWLLFWISMVVVVLVVGFLLATIRRGRRYREQELVESEPSWGEPFILIAGVVVSAIVLLVVFLISLSEMRALSSPDTEPEVEIEVVARDWWWEVRYPEVGASTANEIHIPVGEPVNIKLTTDDVLHSFWVPRLQVKKDAVNGTENELWLQADEPGRYRGQCAEFCGLQHANMLFWVIAEPRDDFDDWIRNEALPAAEPASFEEELGLEVFLSNSCVGCHAIRGTEAIADVGPDLTHLMQRETIAAGVLDNTPGNLSSWILAPHEIKPGAIMPPTTDLTAEELQALVDYLSALD
jgi:cytochrome c oxidase subunit 2